MTNKYLEKTAGLMSATKAVGKVLKRDAGLAVKNTKTIATQIRHGNFNTSKRMAMNMAKDNRAVQTGAGVAAVGAVGMGVKKMSKKNEGRVKKAGYLDMARSLGGAVMNTVKGVASNPASRKVLTGGAMNTAKGMAGTTAAKVGAGVAAGTVLGRMTKGNGDGN